MPTENEKLDEQFKALQREVEELRTKFEKNEPLTRLEERVEDIEESNPAAFALDSFTPDMSRSGDLMDVRKMPRAIDEEFKVLPFDIEHCVMKADASGTAATVIVRPTDEKGREYASAADVEVFVANDRGPQLLEDRAWKAKSNATVDGQPSFGDPESTITLSSGTFTSSMVGQWIMFLSTPYNAYEIITYTDSTHVDVTGDAHDEANNDGIVISGDILSFMRLAPTVGGVGGVLVGEARDENPIPVRILNEDSGGGGEYDQWEQVEIDALGVWKTLDGGKTHTSTGESIWEANLTTGIATSTIVWVHLEDGDNIQYTFDYQNQVKVEGGTVPSAVIPDADEGWIYKYNRAGVIEDAHADPRNETVYYPTSKCPAVYAVDARGHVIGWWLIDGGAWESPWGFGDPSL